MIPRLSLRERILAWLIWRYEGFDKDGLEEAGYTLTNPHVLRTTGLLRDYWYIRKARLFGDA